MTVRMRLRTALAGGQGPSYSIAMIATAGRPDRCPGRIAPRGHVRLTAIETREQAGMSGAAHTHTRGN